MSAQKGKPAWNSGTSKGWIDKRGYHWIYVTENGKRRAKRKHRDIMEKHLGRKLTPEEAVHHLDGNPSNNNIDNLQLITFQEHQEKHNTNSTRPEQTRRTMEVMANYREENKHIKRINTELLEALENLLAWAEHNCGASGNDECYGCYNDEELAGARAAIQKARGKQ